MDAIRSMFPDIPENVLLLVMNMCDHDPNAASAYLLDNDWREIERVFASSNQPGEQTQNAVTRRDTTSIGDNDVTTSVSHPYDGEGGLEEEEDEADEEDLDEEDYEDDDGEDLSDEDFSDSDIPEEVPESKRRRVEETPSSRIDPKEKRFWGRFDAAMHSKTHIELLNLVPSKLAHQQLDLVQQEATELSKEAASDILAELDQAQAHLDRDFSLHSFLSPTNGNSSGRLPFDCIGGDLSPRHDGGEDGQATKSEAETEDTTISGWDDGDYTCFGTWCYKFHIEDVDDVWRHMVNAHLFGKKFGKVFRLRSLGRDSFGSMSFYYGSRSSDGTPSPSHINAVALIVPCEAAEDEMIRVGKNLVGVLNLKQPIYFRRILISRSRRENGEPSRLVFTNYKLSRQEPTDASSSRGDSSSGSLNWNSFQPSKKPNLVLSRLHETHWVVVKTDL